MKVVIYGGSGFIGSWITKFLLNNNFQITMFDKKNNKDSINLILIKDFGKLIVDFQISPSNLKKYISDSLK